MKYIFNFLLSHLIQGKNRDKVSLSAYGVFILISSLIITGFLTGIRQLGGLQALELNAFDTMVQLCNEPDLDHRLLIVGITESDIRKQKQWPLSDQVIAELIGKLQTDNPKVIGLDLYRDLPYPPGNAELQRELQADNVIVISEIGGTNDRDGIPPPPGVPYERIGFNDLVLDPVDNVVRRNLMYAETPEKQYYSFSLRASLKYLYDSNLDFKAEYDYLKIGNTVFYPLEANSGGYNLPQSEVLGWQVLLQYRCKSRDKQVSLTEVLEGKVNPELIRNKIVLIGTTAPSGKDLYLTPYSSSQPDEFLMAGVIIHAQKINHILRVVLDKEKQFWFFYEWGEILWIWIWAIVGGFLIWRFHHPVSIGIGIVMAGISLWGICFLLFLNAAWIPVIPPLLALIFSSIGALAYSLFYRLSYDIETKLPTRRLFINQINKSKKQCKKEKSSSIAIICLRLAKLRTIERSFGKEFASQLIKKAISRLKFFIPTNASLARITDDELAIILYSIKDFQEAKEIANQLQEKFWQPFTLNNQDIFTPVNIGVVSKSVDSIGDEGEDFLTDAEIAMYRAQILGKTTPEIFEASMQTQTLMRLNLEGDIWQGIQNDEFIVYYQPIVNLKTGYISGVEALVRWDSPKYGLISPGRFISVAEETGLIIPLGKSVLEKACKQLYIWHDYFPSDNLLTLSVNLSGKQFNQPNLLQQVKDILLDTRIKRHTLKLEITESLMMDNVEDAINLLHQLKGLDLKLSIDDFGTGYSSFSYLHRFPLDTLKVDKAFVLRMLQNEKYAEIVRTIVVLGHNLGMDIIAEGIETEEHMKYLARLGCEYGQGYFFAKPMPADSMTEVLAENPRWDSSFK